MAAFSILFVGAMLAGWVDAVIGGGGLIMIPLLLSVLPSLAPATALGTNKVSGVSGTTSAAIIMVRSHGAPKRRLAVYIPIALVCSAIGAACAAAVKQNVMRPVIILLLLVVGVIVALRPDFGTREREPRTSRMRQAAGVGAVATLALYDGIFGPGTGMFLIMALTSIFSQNFLSSAVMAKVINAATNLGALIFFAFAGHVWWWLGIGLAVGNVIGAQIGARTVLGGGAKLLRYALLTVVAVMSSYLTYQQLS